MGYTNKKLSYDFDLESEDKNFRFTGTVNTSTQGTQVTASVFRSKVEKDENGMTINNGSIGYVEFYAEGSNRMSVSTNDISDMFSVQEQFVLLVKVVKVKAENEFKNI